MYVSLHSPRALFAYARQRPTLHWATREGEVNDDFTSLSANHPTRTNGAVQGRRTALRGAGRDSFPRRRRAFFPAPNTADGAECCYDGQLAREHTYVAEAPAGSAKAEYVTEHVARQSSAMRHPITGTACTKERVVASSPAMRRPTGVGTALKHVARSSGAIRRPLARDEKIEPRRLAA